MDYKFRELEEHLSRSDDVDRYTKSLKKGRTITFGMINRPNFEQHISKNTWLDPKLYQLLIQYANYQYMPPFTSIDLEINKQYTTRTCPKRIGLCWTVAFGKYEGGGMILGNNPEENIFLQRLMFDSSIPHSITDFTGMRYQITYYTLNPPIDFPLMRSLKDFEVVWKDGSLRLQMYKTGEPVQILDKEHPLLLPIKDKKINIIPITKSFGRAGLTPAQKLMLEYAILNDDDESID